jgi:HlyD family secretion protein
MNSKKGVLIVVFILLAAGIAYYFYSSKNKNQTILWRTTTVEKGDVNVVVTATGSMNALTTVQVGTQVSGTISKLFVDFNSVVKKGDVIAILDTTFLAAAKEDADAAKQKAEVQVAQSKREFDRAKKLFDDKVTAQVDFDLALSNYETAQTILRSAKAQVSRATINLQYATILAPISGVIISRNIDVGQTVIASFNTPTLFTIANDLTKMQVQANVDEADIGQIKVGQKVNFNVDAYPYDVFKGEIKQVRLQPAIVQNVVNYVVIIDVPNPDLKLMPGLTANIEVNIESHKDIFKIPANAISFNPPSDYFDQLNQLSDSTNNFWKRKLAQPFDASKTKGENKITEGFIWIKKGVNIFPIPVKIGLSDGTYAEISGDVKVGDEVATGVNHNQDVQKTTTSNPFMPKFPERKKKN